MRRRSGRGRKWMAKKDRKGRRRYIRGQAKVVRSTKRCGGCIHVIYFLIYKLNFYIYIFYILYIFTYLMLLYIYFCT